MNKIALLSLAVVLSAGLCMPGFAATALEQFQALGLEVTAELPRPAPGNMAGGKGFVRAKALEKLSLFNYQKSDVLSVKRNPPEVHKKYTIEKIELLINDPLRALGEFKQDYLFYKTSLPGARPTVIVFPPFSGTKWIDDWASTYFVKEGYNAVVVVPAESLTDRTRPLNKINDILIRGVISGRMCVDLIETFPEVDKDRIYAYGVSMGGIRTTLIFGIEPRIKKAAEIVGGGDIPGILTDSRYRKLTGVRDARMEIEGISSTDDFRAYMEETISVDPLDFAGLRAPEDIFLVLGHGDRFVPDVYQKRLYDAFSRPQEGRYPGVIRSGGGHIPTVLKFKRYLGRFMEFFES